MGQTQGGSSGNLELLKQIEDLKDDVILLTVQGEKVPVSGHGPYNADITVPIIVQIKNFLNIIFLDTYAF